MKAKEFIQENYPVTASQFERKECVGLNDVALICDKFAVAKIGWLDYPEHTPKEDEGLIVWDGKKITAGCHATKYFDDAIAFVCGYSWQSYEVENVTKFMYLKNLRPE